MKVLQRSLVVKLSLAFIAIALVSVALVYAFVRFTSVDRFSTYIIEQQRSAYQTELEGYYAVNGNWTEIAEYWKTIRADFNAGVVLQPEENPIPSRLPVMDRRMIFGLADANRQVLIGVDPDFPAGSVIPPGASKDETPILVNGRQVGTLFSGDFQPRFTEPERRFLDRMNQVLLLAVGIAILLAILMGIFIARTLIRPLRTLTAAADDMASGNLEQEVTIDSQDEIAQLGRAFNTMSARVANANQLRQQMTADIAHDLRTPLTVISGYIESMRDGVLTPTPERLDLIYSEIDRLQDLVGDLRLLSRADAGELPLHRQELSPAYLLERAAAPFRPGAEQQGVALQVEAAEDLPPILVDEGRMMQVFSNLLSNALRYTPSGGQITLSAERDGDGLCMRVHDTGSGISPDALPHLFDRLYRVDGSRHSEHGESGLGLAIARALVEMHGGTIRAESGPGAGTTLSIWLPFLRE